MAQQANFLINNSQKFIDDRLRRIVEESYEVAFILCNSEVEVFGISKIFDIFNQIFPTGYVLSTGYWPFFSTIYGQCLCICGRYGIKCRHTKNNYHWIDMQPIENHPETPLFYPKQYGPVVPSEYDLSIKSLIENPYCYDININLKLQYKVAPTWENLQGHHLGMRKRQKMKNYKNRQQTTYLFAICSRFNIHSEYYPSYYTIVFNPNPFHHNQYATYFRSLILLRNMEFGRLMSSPSASDVWFVAVDQMPQCSMFLEFVNVPEYIFPEQLPVVTIQSQFYPNNIQQKRQKATQTPWEIKVLPETGKSNFDAFYGVPRQKQNTWSSNDQTDQVLTAYFPDFVPASTNQASIKECNDVLIINENIQQPTNIASYSDVVKTRYVPKQEDVANSNLGNSLRVSQGITPQMVENFSKSAIEPDSTSNSANINNRLQPATRLPYSFSEEAKRSSFNPTYPISLTEPSTKTNNFTWLENFFPPVNCSETKIKKEVDDLDLLEQSLQRDLDNFSRNGL